MPRGKKKPVDTADYWAEVSCDDDICEFRVLRQERANHAVPKIVQNGEASNLEQAVKEGREALKNERYRHGWVRIYSNEPYDF